MKDRIILILGKIIDDLLKCRTAYLASKNTHNVNNYGGIISDGVVLCHPENITIGKNSYIIGGYVMASPNAHIFIGDNCLISYAVHIRTSTHNYQEKSSLINLQGHIEKDITIGNDVWIGFGAQIMPGVQIAQGSIIGAGAIVTKNTEPYGVYAGVPARLIKYRQ